MKNFSSIGITVYKPISKKVFDSVSLMENMKYKTIGFDDYKNKYLISTENFKDYFITKVNDKNKVFTFDISLNDQYGYINKYQLPQKIEGIKKYRMKMYYKDKKIIYIHFKNLLKSPF